LINKLLELYQVLQISIISPLDKKLVIKKTSLYYLIKPEFDRFQIVTIQEYIQELIGRFTLKETQEKYQGRLNAIIGGNFSDEDKRERLIWLLFTMGFTDEDINKIRDNSTQSIILKRLGE
ncbi:MAG: hypothetical protein ACKO7A_02275, partial [Microcystis sp.]